MTAEGEEILWNQVSRESCGIRESEMLLELLAHPLGSWTVLFVVVAAASSAPAVLVADMVADADTLDGD